ncbi:MAG: hypothetical protein OQJ99_07365 [Rhodospirillales bacterium]|nr:hypothetical protein [Rhodospirillales bacterium]MCW8861566.1 hypothetical protein [Rhodospirillales bacterium]
MGAQMRLLPPTLPFRFFGAAAVMHVAVWLAGFWAAEGIPAFSGGPGPVLAVIHILTLGVFGMTAMGAAFQLLPVATGVAHRSLVPVRLAWWLYLSGAVVLFYGFATSIHAAMLIGGIVVAAGFMVFLAVVASLLRRARTLPLQVRFAWVGLVSLLLLVVLGLALIEDLARGFLPDHQFVGLAHLILAAFGFMGMLTMGFSYILVPMFALSANPPGPEGSVSFFLALGAVAVGVAGALVGSAPLLGGAALLGAVASAAYIRAMLWSLRNGMRKNLGLSFVLIKAAWLMLPVCLVMGGAAAFGMLGEHGPVLFTFMLLFGWLLTFLMGILQRIIPFLAAMNMSKKGKKPPRLSELAEAAPLKIHAFCHALALIAVGSGIAFDSSNLIRGGAVAGVVGALAFLWFTVTVLRSYRDYHKESDGGSAPLNSATPVSNPNP